MLKKHREYRSYIKEREGKKFHHKVEKGNNDKNIFEKNEVSLF